MSKTYKTYVIKENNNVYTKKKFNKRLRRTNNKSISFLGDIIPNGSAYKKFNCSWDICDYKYYEDYTLRTKSNESFKYKKK